MSDEARAPGGMGAGEAGLREAIALAEGESPRDLPRILGLRWDLADALAEEDREREVEAILRDALETCARELEPAHPCSLHARLRLAFHCQERLLLDEAESLYRENLTALEMALDMALEEASDAFEFEATDARRDLAQCLCSMDRHEECESLEREVLAWCERERGEASEETVEARAQLAATLRILDRHSEAEPLLRRVVEARTRILGPDDEATLDAAGDLADTLDELGRIAEAEELLADAIARRRRTAGESDPLAIRLRIQSAKRDLARGRPEAAARELSAILEIVPGADGGLGGSTEARSILADAEGALGREDLAESLDLECLRAREAHDGSDHPLTLAARLGIAIRAHARGETARARELARLNLERARGNPKIDAELAELLEDFAAYAEGVSQLDAE